MNLTPSTVLHLLVCHTCCGSELVRTPDTGVCQVAYDRVGAQKRRCQAASTRTLTSPAVMSSRGLTPSTVLHLLDCDTCCGCEWVRTPGAGVCQEAYDRVGAQKRRCQAASTRTLTSPAVMSSRGLTPSTFLHLFVCHTCCGIAARG